MADIDVQRKAPAIWPWIIGLLVLGLLIWFLVEMFDDDEALEEPVAAVVEPAPAPPTSADAGQGGVPAPVQQYLTTCAERAPEAMGLDHQYTSDCIRRLVDGIEATLQNPNLSGVDVQAQLDAARQQAQRLAQSANQSTQHAGTTREAFLSIATLLNSVQDARYPELDGQVTQLEETARSVQASGSLLDQREPVQRFFQQAGEVLNGIARAPAAGV